MYETIAEEYEYKGFSVKIMYDLDPANPMEDHCGMPTILHWHRRYDLGTEYPDDFGHPFEDRDAVIERIKKEYGARVVIPVYLYDHSGITMSTAPFSCPWDSGQVGFVFDTPDMLRDGWGDNPPTDEDLRDKILPSCIETYDQYLRGEIFGYVVEAPEGEDAGRHDSCWGYYAIEDAKSDAEAGVDYEVRHEEQEQRKIARCMAL